MAKRLWTTCSGVRTHGFRVKTVATVAIFLRLAFDPFVGPDHTLGPVGFDQRNPLAIHRRDENRPGLHRRRVCPLGMERIEVLGGILDHFLHTALGDGHVRDLGNALDGFVKRALPGSLHHVPLQFTGERARGQLENFIEGIDTGDARPTVAHSHNFDGAEDGFQPSPAEPPVGIQGVAEGAFYAQGRSDVSVSRLLDVSLEEQALYGACSTLLLGLDLVQRE